MTRRAKARRNARAMRVCEIAALAVFGTLGGAMLAALFGAAVGAGLPRLVCVNVIDERGNAYVAGVGSDASQAWRSARVPADWVEITTGDCPRDIPQG